MNVYVASSFLNKEGARKIQYLLKQNGHRITADWTIHDPTKSIDRLKIETLTDMRGIVLADVLVIVWPGRYTTSTELGIALGIGIPVLVLGPLDVLTQARVETHLFLNHPLVEFVETEEKLLDRLYRMDGYLF